MLTHLTVRNIVLIEALDLEFGPGLCVLTGETGSGKSILLDSLGLVLGERAEARLVRSGAEQGSAAAVFETAGLPQVRAVLQELGLEAEEDELRLRRVVTADGKSRAFVNDIPVSVSALKQLGGILLEMHGQHDQRGLLDTATHREWLDGFGGLTNLSAQVADASRDWLQAEKAVREAAETLARLQQEEEYVRHVAAELEALDPQPDEENQLAERRRQLMQYEKLAGSLLDALRGLEESGGAQQAVSQVEKSLWKLDATGFPTVQEASQALERAGQELENAREYLQAAVETTQFDPAEQEKVEERLFALRDAARKHHCAVEALPEKLKELQTQLQALDAQDRFAAEREAKRWEARERFVTLAGQLTDKRKEAAAKLEARMHQELAPLKMEKARFVVELEALEESRWFEGGMESVRFLVATNPGTPAGPLAKIASGGELSRFMLALKVALSEVKSVPCLVFDEVDTGIGGAVASAVGSRLALLADPAKGAARQVFVVTHQPQVAAFAGQHYRVTKRQLADATHTLVEPLRGEQRREELARMLAGEQITEQARAAADSLLQVASA